MFYLILTVAIIILICVLRKKNRKFCKMKLDTEKIFTCQNDLFIKYFFQTYKSDPRPIILYVVNRLEVMGGVEVRMAAYCRELTKHGFRVIIASEYNNFPELLCYDNVYLNFSASNIQQCLNQLVSKLDVHYLEFHFKTPEIIRNLNFEQFQPAKIGCMIHNIVDASFLNRYNFDYMLVVSTLLKNKYQKLLPVLTVIPNAVKKEDISYRHPQNAPFEAIIVSRISREKLPTLKAFIEFCQKNGIIPRIGGPQSSQCKIEKRLMKQYNLRDDNFFGLYDMNDLSANSGRFLFVGGVGQAALNAGVLGYPVFLASHLGLKYSLFLTAENLNIFASENFTVKRRNIYPATHSLRRQALNDIMTGNYKPYDLNKIILQHYEFDKVFAKYMQILKNCD